MLKNIKQYICGAVFFIGLFVLTGTDSSDITVFVIKNLIALAVMVAAAVVGDFIDKPVHSKAVKGGSENVLQENNIEERDNDPEGTRV